MSSFKSKIKAMLPDKVVYSYDVVKTVPQYINSLIKSRNEKYPSLKFYTDTETVDLIIGERKSMSRFGDGEMLWMNGVLLESFQAYSDDFAMDLKKAFQSDNPNLLIGIPYGLVDSSKCNLYAKMHWKTIKSRFFSNLLKIADLNRTYCNASITRPYIDYRDYQFSTDNFNNLKRIWDQRDIVFVEGEKTKLGMGNDLFGNAKSIKRIICPAQNAYEKKEEIKNSILNNVSRETMILGALGPTASILAAEMTDLGYQFIDIGHVDVEYIWYKRHSILREPIEGKFVNESGTKECSDFYDNDEEYLNSIIDRVL